jgi:hypothetical protein
LRQETAEVIDVVAGLEKEEAAQFGRLFPSEIDWGLEEASVGCLKSPLSV